MVVIQEILVANCTGILVLIVCLMSRFENRREKHFDAYAFEGMIWLTMLALIAETVASLIDGQPGALVNAFQYILNAYTFVASSGVAFLWVLFVDSRIFHSTKRIKTFFCVLIAPFLLIVVLLACDIFGKTGFIFSVNDANAYERGNLVLISYIFIFIAYLLSAAIAVMSIIKDCYAKFFPVHFFVIPCVVGTIIQGRFYGISVGWLCVALSILFIQMHLANQDAYEDELSGLYNRKYFNLVINKLSSSSSKRRVYGVYMDIDSFKEINDKFGHSMGDDAIAQIGRLLSNISKHDRMAFRYGGDEFIVLDTNGTEASANRLTEDIRREFKSFNDDNDKPYKLFVSLGRAEYDVAEKDPEHFLRELDTKMYQQKALKNASSKLQLDDIADLDEGRVKKKLESAIRQSDSVKTYFKFYLDRPKREDTLNLLLEDLGGYYKADRAYIFEINEKEQTTSNTYEWCDEGVTPEIDNLQNLPLSLVQGWIDAFEEEGEFYISSLSEEYDPEDPTYKILDDQNIESLMVAPIYVEGAIKGYLGVDNPRDNIDDMLLLVVVAATAYSEITNREFFHHAKAESDRKLALKDHIIKSMSEIYTCVYYFDLIKGDYIEVYSVDTIRDKVGTEGNAKDKLEYFAKAMVAPECVEYMVEFVDLSTLRERLHKFKIVSAQYRSLNWEGFEDTGGMWHECAFMAGDYDEDGNVTHAIFTARSIHGLKLREIAQNDALREAYELAESASQAKSVFLSSMSHEMRTPMNGIIGMTAIASANIDDRDKVDDCLQKISGASSQLLNLINEVLDMNKIESGKIDLVEEEFNLSDLIENLLVVNEPFINDHKHKLITSVSNIEHEDVIGDSLQIQKVFNNLLSNAVKYTPSGGLIRITITEKPSDTDTIGCYEFIFEDNGIGMSPEFIETIFEPFARASQSLVRTTQGTGLGMPISRNIVRMLGGDIQIESKEGVGSKFTVSMYLKLQDKTPIDCTQFEGMQVLVADDDEMSLEACCGVIDKLGMKADPARNGAETVEKVLQHHKDKQDYFACLIDWKMPDMDGVAVVKRIRRTLGPNAYIIIISAYDWSEIEKDARDAGVNAFISKPLFPSKLVRNLEELLGQREEEEEEDNIIAQFSDLDLSGRRALLVEDNMLNAEIAMDILEMTGLAVEHVVDGAEAIERINECEDGYYNIIFMDIQMPRVNGHEATHAIRGMERDYCKKVPIIAMTANAFAEDKQKSKAAGMDDHIAKPIDLNELAGILVKYIK